MLLKIQEKRKRNGAASLEVGQPPFSIRDWNINYRMVEVSGYITLPARVLVESAG